MSESTNNETPPSLDVHQKIYPQILPNVIYSFPDQ